MKALVLAAGLGTRLRPITNSLPKPLVPIMGVALIDLVIRRLNAAGITETAVNTSYLSEKIKDHLNRLDGSNFYLSHEEPVLETGGAINPLREWLGSDSLLIANGDILTNLPLEDLIAHHNQSDGIATMATLQRPHDIGRSVWTDRDFTVKDISIDADQKVDRLPLGFTGIHIISDRFRDYITPKGKFSIIESYLKALGDNQIINAKSFDCIWQDIGTIDGLFEAHLTLSRYFQDFGKTMGQDFGFKTSELDRLILKDTTIETKKILAPTFIESREHIVAGESFGPNYFGYGKEADSTKRTFNSLVYFNEYFSFG